MTRQSTPINPNGIGGRIRAARIASGMTQAELAEKLGITQTRLSAWERGVGLTVPQLRWIAATLRISFYKLIAPTSEETSMNPGK